MIDVRLLRTDFSTVRAALTRRSADLEIPLSEAVAADETLRAIARERDELRHRIKELSQQVGSLRKAGEIDQAEAVAEQSRTLRESERDLDTRTAEVEAELREILLRLPNLPHPEAPAGASDADNPVVKGPVNDPGSWAEHQRVPHWETGAELGILDNERATKIAKSMFTMQRGPGAALARGLMQFALDANADDFEEIRPPSLVSTSTLTATGHLPKFANDAFAVERDDLWLIPTGEVPLTSLYAGEVLDGADLPIRLMAATPCFRREAGSAGRDTRGMLRTHEFDKVEILALTTPDQAPEMLDELVGRAEALIAALGLTYRIIEICTGDMGQSHHRSFDLEVYAPGVDAWLEVSSVSWFAEYQARRAEIRYKTAGDKGTHLVHTLNGSALAVPRVWAALVETYRQPDGSVVIPEVLRPYLRGRDRIGPAS